MFYEFFPYPHSSVYELKIMLQYFYYKILVKKNVSIMSFTEYNLFLKFRL